MSWHEVVQRVSPHVVRIETPNGSGTGFLFSYNQDKSLTAIATALHVISHADQWQQPIRISSASTGKSILLGSTDRTIFPEPETDSAVILIKQDLGLPQNTILLLPDGFSLPVGSSVGWLGFPGIAGNTMCFFRGAVSAIVSDTSGALDSYLIDGVAINGVSGGPVIYEDIDTPPTLFIVGTLSAYLPNRQYGEALPGLSIAQRVSHFNRVLQDIKDFDEAQQKKEELEAERNKQEKELNRILE